MIYRPSEFPKELTIKFVRDDKDVLLLAGHLRSVFRARGNILYFAEFSRHSSGCTVVAYDLSSGKKLWRSDLQAMGNPPHSKYRNRVNLELDGGVVRVRGYESFGSYVEIVDAKTGKTLAHRVTSRS